ncbi:uncharacterized protein CTRU02_215514 [Colletotrichum truncatum]|uniref:Uncharacterized protein n=1 Tax=Colletotrichum truncatum TaxID=5467 RepID=A0ACC3YCS1_COLTU|nr:uncharacterized protein CTRU02_05540 [Colletotrichum truncatum]KAF6793983.1 hypothetical protein CTRU02_05540 [Colletotrichum truncatum]
MEVRCGALAEAGWSSRILVVDVVCVVTGADRTFYGVVTENLDLASWDWPRVDGLQWVFHDGKSIRLWQECVQRPHLINGAWDFDVESIVACYETDSGHLYYGVKWAGYECPTWETENDIRSYSHLLSGHDQVCECTPNTGFSPGATLRGLQYGSFTYCVDV